VPAPAAVAAQKAPDPAIHVDPELVEDLDLAEGMPNQGKPVQVSGELRSAPFLAASPSRYRILDTNPDGMLEMVCHVHGNSEELRQYIGKRVSIRGREYWVDRSDMPVVVVGQIVPLSPVYEPVMY
jgi:predicted nucleotidyltransferase